MGVKGFINWVIFIKEFHPALEKQQTKTLKLNNFAMNI